MSSLPPRWVGLFKKSNQSRWILLIDIQKNPDIGPKRFVTKKCSPVRKDPFICAANLNNLRNVFYFPHRELDILRQTSSIPTLNLIETG
jgi:hypothetical protein